MSAKNGFCPARGRSTAGFTFLEFAVTLLLAGLVLSLSVPSLRQMFASNEVISASNAIVAGLNQARSTAITTGDAITICPSDNGTSCVDDAWDSGWIIFNDANTDGAPQTAEVVRLVSIDGAVDQDGFGEEIVFLADGRTSMASNSVITSCPEDEAFKSKCRDVQINRFGLISTSEHKAIEVDEGDGEPM